MLLLAAVAGGRTAGAEAVPRVAVFDFELIDSSLEGEMSGVRPDETRRLVLISDQLRQLLADSGRFAVVDHGPAAAEIAEAGYLYGCVGCAVKIARGLGAELAVTGTVQKVSNLILNINVFVDEVAHGARLRTWSVDIRGNTDQSWRRGVSYLVRNRFLR
jgi:hypothetical protein